MDAKPYAMKILSEEEAWVLFREKVGTCLDDPDLISIAKEVANECKGLPLALTIVGTTLKNKKEKYVWEDAVRQLKNPDLAMPDLLKDVYKPLKLSYESLKPNCNARSLFLLCCIFPEDHNIHLEYLTMYGIGLHMFEGMSLEEARNRVCTLCKMLKGRFLLLDGRDENHVKMHDVVRDVAICIASEEGRVDRNLSLKHSSREESVNCTWISVIGEQINKLPIDLSFPSLRLLSMDNSPNVPEISIIPSFFQGMKELNVFSFSDMSCRSLPETTQLLKNLRTLYLNWCFSLETISIVGQLSSLEILICRFCHNIAELPIEIGRLERLKLLEVSNCKNLKRIAPEVISKLGQLEELIIVGSFVGWERKANGKQRINAALCELEHLKNLTRLDIEIEDVSLVTEEMCFSMKIVNHHIKFMSESMKIVYHSIKRLTSESKINFFHHESGITLEGHDADSFHLFCNQKVSFGNLMEVEIEGLDKRNIGIRRSLCSSSITENLVNLKKLTVRRCTDMRKLFSSAIIKDGLLQLEKLEIDNCEMMEEVLSNEENGMDEVQCHTITFPKLKSLELSKLPKLTSFCKGSENIEFPLLEDITIINCKKLTSLISSTSDNLNLEGHDHNSVHQFCNQKVSFGRLERISIARCNGIRSLFSSSIAANFVNLKYLSIFKCKEMVKVIEDSDEEMLAADQNPHCILFSSLKILNFQYLPKLQSFCNWRCDLMLSSLELVRIYECPLLEMESVIFGNLKEIRIWGCDCKFLFSSSIAKKLVNLEELEIFVCNEMVKVIEDDEEMLAADQNSHCILFPSLKKLDLSCLPKLQSFCNWRCDLMLPSLEHVEIHSCPLLEFFTMGSVSTPNLKLLKTDDYRDKDVGDLNSAIQLHFETNQHQPISTPKAETSTSSDEEESETDQPESEIEKTEMEEETLISYNTQVGVEEDQQKSEIQEAEQINKVIRNSLHLK